MTTSGAPGRLAQRRYLKGGKLRFWEDAGVPKPVIALGKTREPIVPLIGSGVPGPLGLLHLPRLWVEGLLRRTNRIDPAFAAGQPLFDEVVCETIGLDRAELDEYLDGRRYPTYVEFETWVSTNARRLDAAAIAQSNNTLRKATRNGVSLIALDDLRSWDAVRRYVLDHEGGTLEPIIPTLSSRVAGRSGIDHLPRLWLKGILIARGALPAGYRAGAFRVVERGLALVPGGLDETTCAHIALDMARSSEFLASELPVYESYEAWVLKNAGRLDERAIAFHNAVRVDTRSAKVTVEKAYAGWSDASSWAYLVDDLIDWQLLYDVVTGSALPGWTGPRT